MLATILILIYIIPGILTWNYIRVAYSKNGIWDHINPTRTDLFITLCPFINILALLLWVFEYPRKKNNKFLDEFFKVKK